MGLARPLDLGWDGGAKQWTPGFESVTKSLISAMLVFPGPSFEIRTGEPCLTVSKEVSLRK